MKKIPYQMMAAVLLTLCFASLAHADGKAIFSAKMCATCHSSTTNKSGKPGPALGGVGSRRSKAWLTEQLKNPKTHDPASAMPSPNLSAPDIEALVQYLQSL